MKDQNLIIVIKFTCDILYSEDVLKPSIQTVGTCLQCDLRKRMEDLEKNFFEVVQDIENSFREKKLSVSDIKSSLKFIPEHEKYYLEKKPEIRSDIFIAKSLEELFYILSRIWDYLHPGLLQFVVKKFGSDEDKVRVETYLRELNHFRVKTKLGEFLKTTYNRQKSRTLFGKTLSTTMGDTWEEKTLQDMEDYRVQFAEEVNCELFLVKSFPFRSSVTIAFNIPCWIQLNLVKLYPILSSYGAVKVCLNGDCIYECQPEKVRVHYICNDFIVLLKNNNKR